MAPPQQQGTNVVDYWQLHTTRRALGTNRPFTAPTTLTTTLNGNHVSEFKMK